jgi:hypothetical protein
MSNKGFKISEVKPRIFFLDFKDSYNMSMHFLRYQEYYESPSSKFRDQSFAIVDFMEWYSKTYGNGVFTYPKDWSGFNIPGYVIKDVVSLRIKDYNRYDLEMWRVFSRCAMKYPDGQFYIVGAVGKNSAMKHEIAHGFFYTQSEYRKKMTKLVKTLKPSFRKKFFKILKTIGYTPRVFIDECQAYLSTGVSETFPLKLNGEDIPFINLFKEYYND